MDHGNNDSISTATTPLLLQRADLKNLAKTWDITIACRDKKLVKSEMEGQISAKVLDFGQDLPTDTPGDHYDLLISPDISLNSYVLDLAETIGRMCKVVKQGGIMCILSAEINVASIKSVLDANNMETAVFHHTNAGSSLVIAKKHDVPSINGTANGIAGQKRKQITLIQATHPTEAATTVASRLTMLLEKHGYDTDIFSWGSDTSTLVGKSCISLLEFQKSILRDLTTEDFESVKKLLLKTENLFWVTALDDPSAAIIDGLVRVVRNETPGLSVRIFHADEPSSLMVPVERLADMIVKVFFWTGKDNEFHVKGDLVHICRVEEDTVLNEEINSLLPGSTKTVANLSLGEVEYPVKLCVRSPGMLSSVCLEPDDSAELELEPDFVEIQTKATALK